jgi:CheY-like chemotaxis protein/two-component sensor histidine kinase
MLAYCSQNEQDSTAININKIIEQTIHLLKPTLSPKVKFRQDLATIIPEIFGSANQLRKLLINLITNANEAIGEAEGVITISTGVARCGLTSIQYPNTQYFHEKFNEGLYVYLEIIDTGGGMEEKAKQKIFDPFFTTKPHRLGLGLTAVRDVVRLHQGLIKIDSRSQMGTTIKILLPSSEKIQENLAPLQSSANIPQWTGGGTFLLVDDEKEVRKVASRMLKKMGFQVLLAADGMQAIQLFIENQARIKCVLLDLTMPIMSGEDTLKRLREVNPQVRIILSSGFFQGSTTLCFKEAGMSDFIHKPYKYRELEEKIREILGENMP